jgi:hypothetical protein
MRCKCRLRKSGDYIHCSLIWSEHVTAGLRCRRRLRCRKSHSGWETVLTLWNDGIVWRDEVSAGRVAEGDGVSRLLGSMSVIRIFRQSSLCPRLRHDDENPNAPVLLDRLKPDFLKAFNHSFGATGNFEIVKSFKARFV